MKKSLIVFSIMFVLMFSMAASVFGTKALSQQQITNDPSSDNQYPDIYGDIIVWDNIVVDDGLLCSIYGYNILTNQQFVIAEDIGDNGYPEIWGDYVVWMQDDNVSIYNLKTKQVTLVGGNDDKAYWPDIYDGTVVWSENGDIRSYNINSGVFRTISDSDMADYPAINRDIVVWEDDGDIYGFNLKTSTQPFLIRQSGSAYRPAVYGDIVVWEEDTKIWKHSLKTGEQVSISSDMITYAQYPDIYGDIVVWQEGDYSIYGHNLLTGQEFLIRDSADPYNLEYPAIYCGRVVWYENFYHSSEDLFRYQIYLANLDVVCETAKKPLPMDWILKKFGLGKYKNN